MPTPSWAQKRAQIAQALAGGGGSGWSGLGQSLGAGIMANPMLRWGNQGAAAPEMAGGMFGGGQTQGQQMAQANASLQGAPGFNYVPPPVGPAPAPAAAAGAVGAPSMQELSSAAFFGGPGRNLNPEAAARLYNFNNRVPPGGHR